MNLLTKQTRFLFFTISFLVFSWTTFGQTGTPDGFLSAIQQQKYKKAYMMCSAKIQQKMSRPQFKRFWQMVETKFGSLESHEFICEENKASFEFTFYQLEFAKGKLSLKTVMQDKNHISGFVFVEQADCEKMYSEPPYNEKGAYTDKTDSLQTKNGMLHFSIMLPKKTPKIICVFLPGSGNSGRDESIGQNKVFKDLAIGLAVKRVGSVRYDKILPKNEKERDDYTIEKEYVVPVMALVKDLETHFPKQEIYLIGHSLGGMLSPTLAGRTKGISGSVLMAANYRPLGELIVEQFDYLTALHPADERLKERSAKIKKQVAYIKDSLFSENVMKNKLPYQQPPGYWRSVEAYEPRHEKIQEAAKQKPVLVLQGGKDYQVGMKDFNLWKTLLSEKEADKFIVYPNLNHLFLKSPSEKSNPSDYNTPGHIPENVINAIVRWLKNN